MNDFKIASINGVRNKADFEFNVFHPKVEIVVEKVYKSLFF